LVGFRIWFGLLSDEDGIEDDEEDRRPIELAILVEMDIFPMPPSWLCGQSSHQHPFCCCGGTNDSHD